MAECGYCGETDGTPTEAGRCTGCDQCADCDATDDLRGTDERLCEQCEDYRQACDDRRSRDAAREAYWDQAIDEWKERRHERR